LFQSEGCQHQGFLRERILGLQFHLEITPESLMEMLEHGKDELTGGRYIQPEEEIKAHQHLIPRNNQLMFTLLNRFVARYG
jgi:GMP synthase-like glutamine amidotransferase